MDISHHEQFHLHQSYPTYPIANKHIVAKKNTIYNPLASKTGSFVDNALPVVLHFWITWISINIYEKKHTFVARKTKSTSGSSPICGRYNPLKQAI